MGRLLAIDYGQRRCGIAVTDPLRMVANPLTTVETPALTRWLADYLGREEVDAVVVGKPLQMDGTPSESQRFIGPAVGRLKKAFPQVVFDHYDERFTSSLAHRAMIDGGMKRGDRREKGRVDAISAAIILNDYLTYLERLESREQRLER